MSVLADWLAAAADVAPYTAGLAFLTGAFRRPPTPTPVTKPQRRPILVDGKICWLDDDRIDLTPVIRELALLALPLVPLCREDCEGPDATRFPTGPAEDDEVDSDEAAGPPRDERWAALDALTFDD